MADCGCHDNRMDKVWWNEQWMGWPIGPEYDSNSNVTLAQKLQGKLLLIVGELDTNVDPASTMQVVNALIKADKDFELLVVPGADHGAGASTPYGQHGFAISSSAAYSAKNRVGFRKDWRRMVIDISLPRGNFLGSQEVRNPGRAMIKMPFLVSFIPGFLISPRQ